MERNKLSSWFILLIGTLWANSEETGRPARDEVANEALPQSWGQMLIMRCVERFKYWGSYMWDSYFLKYKIYCTFYTILCTKCLLSHCSFVFLTWLGKWDGGWDRPQCLTGAPGGPVLVSADSLSVLDSSSLCAGLLGLASGSSWQTVDWKPPETVYSSVRVIITRWSRVTCTYSDSRLQKKKQKNNYNFEWKCVCLCVYNMLTTLCCMWESGSIVIRVHHT